MGTAPVNDSELQEKLVKLVPKAAGGDSAALAELIELTQNKLFRFCYFLTGNSQQAEDLCQDCFIKILEQLGTLRDPGGFLPWLFRSAKNHFLDFTKSPRSRENVDLEDLPADALELVDDGEKEKILHIQQALKGVSPEEKAVLLLVDLEGYSYAEAADIIGISEAALRSRVHRARKAFLEKLEEE